MATQRITPLRSGGSGLSCVCLNSALELAEARFLQRGWIRQDFSGLIKQWSYRAGATKKSARTHDGGGVVDVAWGLVDDNAKLTAWLESGIIMFPRFDGSFSDEKHGHGVVAGCPHVHPEAAHQIASYRDGFDGLANPRRYPGPTVAFIDFEAARKKFASLLIKEDIDMGTPIDEHGHDAAWYLSSIRDSVLIIGKRTSDMFERLEQNENSLRTLQTTMSRELSDLQAMVKKQNP